MSDGGKGSAPRPFSVDHKTFSDNWDAIFKKDNQPTPQPIDDLAEGFECEGSYEPKTT